MIYKTNIESRLQEYAAYISSAEDLTLKEKGILITLVGMDGNVPFSSERISELCTECALTVSKIVKKLEEKGYIRRAQVRDSNGRTFVRTDIEIFFPKKDVDGHSGGTDEEGERATS